MDYRINEFVENLKSVTKLHYFKKNCKQEQRKAWKKKWNYVTNVICRVNVDRLLVKWNWTSDRFFKVLVEKDNFIATKLRSCISLFHHYSTSIVFLCYLNNSVTLWLRLFYTLPQYFQYAVITKWWLKIDNSRKNFEMVCNDNTIEYEIMKINASWLWVRRKKNSE